MKSIKKIFPKKFAGIFLIYCKKLIIPKSQNEDVRRKELILNLILISIIGLLVFANFSVIYKTLNSNPGFDKSEVLPLSLSFGFLSFFCFLFILSKKGLVDLSSYIFLGTLYIIIISFNIVWGTELVAAILFSVLLITISGILINARFAFFAAILISSSDVILQILINDSYIRPNTDWHGDKFDSQDLIVLVIIFIIIALLSWISNREIDKSLHRARTSEAELIKAKNLLEIKVEERTKKLKELQLRELSQYHRLAEFGKLSAGLFHELANPLTALNLNIEEINEGCKDGRSWNSFGDNLNKATKAAKKIGCFISSIKKQVACQEEKSFFSLNKEIEEAIDIMTFKARKSRVQLIFLANQEIFINGNPLKFHQIIVNLISNAIDSFRNLTHLKNKVVNIKLREKERKIIIGVEDNGCGIKEEMKDKIFEAFYTTKDFQHGSGLGLAIIKNLVEEEFQGKIYAQKRLSQGSRFVFIIKK